MSSLRTRIFALVAAVTLLVWSSAAAWTYFNTRSDVQRVLDRRLVEAANMVGSLAGNLAPARGASQPFSVAPGSDRYSRQLSCQIWSLDGRLLGRSSQAPSEPLTTASTGFSERTIDGERWRVYSLADPQRQIRVLVGDNLAVRQKLVGDLMTGLLLPSLLGILALALLIWAAVGRGLAPLRDIAARLRERDPASSRPLGVSAKDAELKPVVSSIDDLFARLERLRAGERHFIASAAHELQTPLAGLRAHAQIASLAPDAATREKSLQRIRTSVDRTSRLVHQLLELAREEAVTEPPESKWTKVGAAVGALCEDLSAQLERARVRVECRPEAERLQLFIDEGSLALALRNLLENAINHSPPGETVVVDAALSKSTAALSVLDNGPGIPADEIERVRDRFVRGSREKSEGSGLGLSIVDLILARAGAGLELENRPEGGLGAYIVVPAVRARTAHSP